MSRKHDPITTNRIRIKGTAYGRTSETRIRDTPHNRILLREWRFYADTIGVPQNHYITHIAALWDTYLVVKDQAVMDDTQQRLEWDDDHHIRIAGYQSALYLAALVTDAWAWVHLKLESGPRGTLDTLFTDAELKHIVDVFAQIAEEKVADEDLVDLNQTERAVLAAQMMIESWRLQDVFAHRTR